MKKPSHLKELHELAEVPTAHDNGLREVERLVVIEHSSRARRMLNVRLGEA
jgi:hypothetical protein